MGMLAAQSGSGLYLELRDSFPASFATLWRRVITISYTCADMLCRLMAVAVAAFMLRDWLPWEAFADCSGHDDSDPCRSTYYVATNCG